jgi:hypothetical protein
MALAGHPQAFRSPGGSFHDLQISEKPAAFSDLMPIVS